MASQSITKLQQKAERAQAAIARVREEAEIQGHAIAGTVTEVATGFLMGAAEQRYGEGALMGADIPLVVGLPAAALAIAGIGGAPTETPNAILRSIGNACLVIEGYKKGGQLAEQWSGTSGT